MTRFSQTLRLSSSFLLLEPTRFLSLKLARFSLSAFGFCKLFARRLAFKTLALFSMDDFFPRDDDLWDLDLSSGVRPPQRPRLLEDYDYTYDECETEKLYFVSYRWWKNVKSDNDEIGGVLYTVSANDDTDIEILLDLSKEEVFEKDDDSAKGYSGREYALVAEALWLRTLKRHNDFNPVLKDASNIFGSEDKLHDVFPLRIRLSVSWKTDSLVVRINQKDKIDLGRISHERLVSICLEEINLEMNNLLWDNVVDFYERACSIFCSKSKLMRLWDFSGQTTQFFMNERINIPNDSLGNPCKEILIELQVHGIIDSAMSRIKGKDEKAEEHLLIKDSSLLMNRCTGNMNNNLTGAYSLVSDNNSRATGFLGLVGLQNLGNTCFMNSAIQCLAHTPKVVDYFLGDYRKEINYENPLGMKGELALAFGDLLRKLWAPGSRSVAPRTFKLKLATFASQFSGYNQHDSQEFLAFLLDGLHEDLNRVKRKPYIEAKDADGRPDEEVSEEYWRNHLARNDSIIVDLCQGQYRSTLVCPSCNRSSVTFDPFMYLSLPLPSTTMRSMSLVVFCADGSTMPSTFTISVPKSGTLKDIIDALRNACSLRDEETFLIAEIYKNRIFRFLEDPSDSLALIRDEDRLVAYRLPKDDKSSPLIVFIHQQLEIHHSFGRMSSTRKAFGIPLVARLSNIINGFDVHKEFLKLLDPLLLSFDDRLSNSDDGSGNSAIEDSEMDDIDASASPVVDSDVGSDSGLGANTDLSTDFTFYLARIRGDTEGTLIKMNEPLVSGLAQKLEVLVLWSDKMIEKYDTCLLSSLPEVFKPQSLTRPQDSVSLHKCLEAFSKDEPLGPEDMWYCPSCKKPQQASKKLDLWRLPDILVIHLKRFSYSRFMKNKLETFVDFPIYDLDFSSYISPKYIQSSNRYLLYAISNHYGGMGSGHYTAFVSHGGKWYEFDDERVCPVDEDRIKTSAAYVLFYRRIPDK